MEHKEYVDRIEAALEVALPEVNTDGALLGGIPGVLNRSMRYSLLSGGKRLRPAMLLAAAELLGGDLDEAMPFACAVEMIHCYSLIHDDLPGMDDDVLRRGRPTNHVVFGVGQAILAGDGLLNLAFETMLRSALSRVDRLERHVLAIAEIARGAGVRGMIAGQSMDLLLEHKKGGTLSELQFIHENKTAALFVYALRAAARIAGASDEDIQALTRFGRAFGLLFQTVDDLLDVEGDPETIGKSVGKDMENGKLTAVSVYGLGGARELRQQFLDEGLQALEGFSERADYFRQLILETASRRA